MLLSKIVTDARRYQFRDAPFSLRTVEAIVAAGIDLAKFQPLPLLERDGKHVIGGDGHSRLEAVRRLAKKVDGLPKGWRRGKDFDVPHQVVNGEQAEMLAWTANLGRQELSPCEEAKVFKSMLDAGRTLEEIGYHAHRDPSHVTRILALNGLARDIKAAVGTDPAAGGIDVLTATVLAAGFTRHGVDAARQQDLWHRCLKHAMLNFQSAKKFIDAIGPKLGGDSGGDLLFKLPANAAAVLAEAQVKASACRSASIGVSLLLKAHERGGLKGVPDLAKWVERRGDAVYRLLRDRVTGDADVLTKLVKAG